jgi:hypothetical protein
MRGNLFAYQREYFERFQVGQTFETRLLGRVGYFTMDPKNLEAMLQTRFDGKPTLLYAAPQDDLLTMR